jgi:uncharacterized protein YbjT (DUF2867 family)
MSTPASPRTILVIGAIGKQGGAVIDHILASKEAKSFHVIAVTRDSMSSKALKLASRPRVTVIEGDLSNAEKLFTAAERQVWGVYSVQINSDSEEQHGRGLIDAAIAHGISHFVYSSCDRGGPEKSASDPTDVKNFAAKFYIEKYLEARAASSPQEMTYTLLRPVTFFDNLTPDIHGRGFARMWEQLGSKKLQFISTDDIGWFAAQSFFYPEQHRNEAITLVGDELTQPDADIIFREVIGHSMPMAPCIIGSAVKFVQKDTVGDMFRWFEAHGYGGSVDECRLTYPRLRDFRSWLKDNKGGWV